jgi:hypothetical protein
MSVLMVMTPDPDTATSGQREGHRVGARRQIGDAVLPGPVADDGPAFFNEGRTRCLDGHTGQHRGGRVANDSGYRGLGVHAFWQ